MANSKATTRSAAQGEVFKESIEEPLTDRELLAYGDELGQLDLTLSQATQRHQTEKQKFKAESEDIVSRQQIVISRIRSKKEYKQIDCYNTFVHADGICEIRRADTHALVRTRNMTAEEYREPLPFPKLAEAGEPQSEDEAAEKAAA